MHFVPQKTAIVLCYVVVLPYCVFLCCIGILLCYVVMIPPLIIWNKDHLIDLLHLLCCHCNVLCCIVVVHSSYDRESMKYEPLGKEAIKKGLFGHLKRQVTRR